MLWASRLLKMFEWLFWDKTLITALTSDDGLSGSTGQLPPSLRNIYKEMVSASDAPCPKVGFDLWAQQGVLLLNTTLTVREHAANSHAKLGWQILTNHVIEQCFMLRQPVVFLAWGRHAVTLVEDARSRAAGKAVQAWRPSIFSSDPIPRLFPQISRVGN